MPQRITPTFKAVVLLSGGLDSAYNLGVAAHRFPSLLALTFDYGQRARGPETKAARSIAASFGATHKVVRLPWLGELAPAAITDITVPLPTRPGCVRRLWVPNRNGVFVAVGAAYAEKYNAPLLITGFNAEEAADFPDNSIAFVRAANRGLRYSTGGRVRLVSFSTRMDKLTIIRKALALDVPLEKVYPCYTEGPRPCGRCVSCRRMAKSLRGAGFPDVAVKLFGTVANR